MLYIYIYILLLPEAGVNSYTANLVSSMHNINAHRGGTWPAAVKNSVPRREEYDPTYGVKYTHEIYR